MARRGRSGCRRLTRSSASCTTPGALLPLQACRQRPALTLSRPVRSNGFSGGVDTEAFNGPDPLWRDVLRKHEEKPIVRHLSSPLSLAQYLRPALLERYPRAPTIQRAEPFLLQHVMVGGGDQIYNDPLTREPEIAPWINETDVAKKIAAPFTDEMKFALDRFFFNACAPSPPLWDSGTVLMFDERMQVLRLVPWGRVRHRGRQDPHAQHARRPRHDVRSLLSLRASRAKHADRSLSSPQRVR